MSPSKRLLISITATVRPPIDGKPIGKPHHAIRGASHLELADRRGLQLIEPS